MHWNQRRRRLWASAVLQKVECSLIQLWNGHNKFECPSILAFMWANTHTLTNQKRQTDLLQLVSSWTDTQRRHTSGYDPNICLACCCLYSGGPRYHLLYGLYTRRITNFESSQGNPNLLCITQAWLQLLASADRTQLQAINVDILPWTCGHLQEAFVTAFSNVSRCF